ncbi:MAG: transcription-repair coupling factor [Deltaproteobacteria bacterium]|nr:transcription-repair coupling factor [Deltaproteobacteria bacterium]
MEGPERERLAALSRALGADGARLRAEGLRGSSRAYLLAQVLARANRPMLVVTATQAEARTFATELSFFLGSDREPAAGPSDPRVALFPSWDSSPFEAIPPHPDVSARRIAALFRARQGGAFALVAPIGATLQRVFPPEVFDASSLHLATGAHAPRESLSRQLAEAGYRFTGQVEERGEASLRGGIVDLSPPFYRQPLRLDLFGDEIESIRTFDPATQRSTGRLEEALILPAREVVGGEDALERALARLRRRCRELGMTTSQTGELLESLRESPFSPLREALLPYFYDRAVPLWAHLPDGAVLVLDEAARILERGEEVMEEEAQAHERALAKGAAMPALDEVYVAAEQWAELLSTHRRLDLEEAERASPPSQDRSAVVRFATASNRDLVDSLRQKRGGEKLLSPLSDLIAGARERGHAVYLVARTPGLAHKLRDFLTAYDIDVGPDEPFPLDAPASDARIRLCLGPLLRGFRFPAQGLVVVTEAEILGEKLRRTPVRRAPFRSSLADLEAGNAVVHADFGIGVYRGLVRLDVQGEEGDYLHLEYADGDRLYVPVTRIGLVQKYWGPEEGLPRLDKLGGKAWEKARRKAEEGIEKMAYELLDLYARRQLAERPPYGAADLTFHEFEATFPYEETPDQLSAIADVLRDLEGPRPMDRLICGDVGYGKTEVAIRAALRAVLDGRQVAVLVPTTVLAAQHFQSFRRRFEGYPIEVEMLSRFVSAAEQRDVCERLAKGRVDVVVGTHRLLQRDVTFRNLGLVVVDEEHRFGVAQKERLKQLRAHVDVLTLSATPIPRTLHMGLAGVRDLSIIETPPADRLAVRTLLARFDEEVIRDAIRRELARSGQVYFVHNRVQSIADLAEQVRSLVPEARLGIGHGQMGEKDLEAVMRAFIGGELDVLVCTAIIESGLDIPRANTILINRADQFGLADLYQLRGRVGRSNLRAYAYLLVPSEAELTEDARKRLQALQEFTELGAGFKIATHDLEIRGAGELLGKSQSGQMAAIGFDLYADLLERAVLRLRGEPAERPPEPEIHLKIPAHFPSGYVEDPGQRLTLYERLTRAADGAEVDDLRYELIDRYGPLPLPAEHLLEVMKIRRRLVGLRALGLDYNGKELVLSFDENPGVDPAVILELLRNEPARCRITPDHRVKWQTGALEIPEVLRAVTDLLNRLG